MTQHSEGFNHRDDTAVAGRDTRAQLVGDSLTNRGDSDRLRSAEVQGRSSANAILDPPGNEFRLADASGKPNDFERKNPHAMERPGPPAVLKVDDHSQVLPTNDPSVKSMEDNHGDVTTIRFGANGNVQDKSVTDSAGTKVSTSYDAQGRPTGETVTPRGGQPVERQPNPNDTMSTTHNQDGSTSVQYRTGDTITGLDYDQNGHLTSRTDETGNNQHQVSFDENGKPTKDTHAVFNNGRIVEQRTRSEGFNQSIHFGPGKEFTSVTTDQHDEATGRLDPENQRTDKVVAHQDGSHDVTTNFAAKPDTTFQTHIDANGNYVTDKIDKATGDRHFYEKGKEHIST